jgi:hypothetical protein
LLLIKYLFQNIWEVHDMITQEGLEAEEEENEEKQKKKRTIRSC